MSTWLDDNTNLRIFEWGQPQGESTPITSDDCTNVANHWERWQSQPVHRGWGGRVSGRRAAHVISTGRTNNSRTYVALLLADAAAHRHHLELISVRVPQQLDARAHRPWCTHNHILVASLLSGFSGAPTDVAPGDTFTLRRRILLCNNNQWHSCPFEFLHRKEDQIMLYCIATRFCGTENLQWRRRKKLADRVCNKKKTRGFRL